MEIEIHVNEPDGEQTVVTICGDSRIATIARAMNFLMMIGGADLKEAMKLSRRMATGVRDLVKDMMEEEKR